MLTNEQIRSMLMNNRERFTQELRPGIALIGQPMWTESTVLKTCRAIESAARQAQAKELAEPYPESMFTPLSEDEMKEIKHALEVFCPVNAPLDRLHAGWARHWSKVLLDEAAQPLDTKAG